jgi:hypothetical protein
MSGEEHVGVEKFSLEQYLGDWSRHRGSVVVEGTFQEDGNYFVIDRDPHNPSTLLRVRKADVTEYHKLQTKKIKQFDTDIYSITINSKSPVELISLINSNELLSISNPLSAFPTRSKHDSRQTARTARSLIIPDARRKPFESHPSFAYRKYYGFKETGADLGRLFNTALTHAGNPGDEPQNRSIGITSTDPQYTYTRAGLMLVYPRDETPIFHGIQPDIINNQGAGPVFEVTSGRGLELWVWICVLTDLDSSQINNLFKVHGVVNCNVYGAHPYGYELCVTNVLFGAQNRLYRTFAHGGDKWTKRLEDWHVEFSQDHKGICTINMRIYAGRFIQFITVDGYIAVKGVDY